MSSFKKAIYGSMINMKYKQAIDVLKKNKKNLVIKKSLDIKELYN